MKWILGVVVALCVVLVGCTEEELARAEQWANHSQAALEVGAGAATATPAAPIAPILAVLAAGAGAVAGLLKGRRTRKGVSVGFFDSRKNKLTAVGFVACAIAYWGVSQEWWSAELAKTGLTMLGGIIGINIAGIAYEDGKEKSAFIIDNSEE